MAFLYEVSCLVSIPMTNPHDSEWAIRIHCQKIPMTVFAQSEAGDVSNETSPAVAEHVTHQRT